MSDTMNNQDRPPRKVVVRCLDALLRDALASWVQALPGHLVAGAVTSGPELLRLCTLRSPHLAVVEIRSADADELRLLDNLRRCRPRTYVVGVHHSLDTHKLLRLHRAGADRLVSSRYGLPTLRAALLGAGTGPPSRSASGGLSGRELEILALISAGCPVVEVADVLGISPHTVTNHKRRIFAKLEVHSRTEAAAEAGRLGLAWRASVGPAAEGLFGGPPGALHDEVARVLSTHGIAARPPVTILVEPTESCWRAAEQQAAPIIVIDPAFRGRNAVAGALLRGASATLTGDRLAERLPAAIALTAAGYLVATGDPVRALLAESYPAAPTTLTPRERDVLDSISRGHSVRQTAHELGITIKTVQSIQRQLFSKLRVHNRTAALELARRLGLVSPPTGT
ncbi:helix-turn-helix domain-containing protein [Amycolatopsis cihanbeyliensis]|uniref:DNA-binding NarL/FixJ family response regulator n=1 Tax=Amycolatopsis cihanbeyliensis TaxID=1128664 RepID=A0A542DN67_AMYCI|nr:LuxR C-terminal-related transcriptional regulator [Amycolatopsis cihanbeyliensis]TQJ04549.1 DNA-binding NarL/FixJ family response regulator [Amycolatopsis cihanbeyliensis]